MKGNRKAFTLIELLIVIGIIGILASVVLVKLTDSKQKARNSEKKAKVAQLAKAVQIYHATYGSFPSNADITGHTCVVNRDYAGVKCLQELVLGGIIPDLPAESDNLFYFNYVRMQLLKLILLPWNMGLDHWDMPVLMWREEQRQTSFGVLIYSNKFKIN